MYHKMFVCVCVFLSLFVEYYTNDKTGKRKAAESWQVSYISCRRFEIYKPIPTKLRTIQVHLNNI